MPKVCRYRPNRTKKPKFTACDAARIAAAAAKNGESRSTITSTVGFRLGYFKLIDGSRLSEGELQRRIAEILKTAGTIEDILSQIPVFSRLGLTIRIVTRFATSFAFLAASVAILIINEETITGAKSCGK